MYNDLIERILIWIGIFPGYYNDPERMTFDWRVRLTLVSIVSFSIGFFLGKS